MFNESSDGDKGGDFTPPLLFLLSNRVATDDTKENDLIVALAHCMTAAKQMKIKG